MWRLFVMLAVVVGIIASLLLFMGKKLDEAVERDKEPMTEGEVVRARDRGDPIGRVESDPTEETVNASFSYPRDRRTPCLGVRDTSTGEWHACLFGDLFAVMRERNSNSGSVASYRSGLLRRATLEALLQSLFDQVSKSPPGAKGDPVEVVGVMNGKELRLSVDDVGALAPESGASVGSPATALLRHILELKLPASSAAYIPKILALKSTPAEARAANGRWPLSAVRLASAAKGEIRIEREADIRRILALPRVDVYEDSGSSWTIVVRAFMPHER